MDGGYKHSTQRLQIEIWQETAQSPGQPSFKGQPTEIQFSPRKAISLPLHRPNLPTTSKEAREELQQSKQGYIITTREDQFSNEPHCQNLQSSNVASASAALRGIRSFDSSKKYSGNSHSGNFPSWPKGGGVAYTALMFGIYGKSCASVFTKLNRRMCSSSHKSQLIYMEEIGRHIRVA